MYIYVHAYLISIKILVKIDLQQNFLCINTGILNHEKSVLICQKKPINYSRVLG